ncbi:MAG: InlB B-repeat-containing protein [Lachnospiraceae bacterium]
MNNKLRQNVAWLLMFIMIAGVLGNRSLVSVQAADTRIPTVATLFGSQGDNLYGVSITGMGTKNVYADNGTTVSEVVVNSVTATVTDCDAFLTQLNVQASYFGQPYDNTISGEQGSVEDQYYLKYTNGSYTLTQPEWFEGNRKVKISATDGTDTVTYNFTIPRKSGSVTDNGTISNYVDIGNTDSENNNQLLMVRANNPETLTLEGETYSYRTLKPRGSFGITLKCDPEKQNYFTVKLWGNDTHSTADGMLWVTDPATNCIGVSPNNNTAEAVNVEPIRTGGTDRKQYVELSFLGDDPQCENGFIYSTYIIPKTLTKGKEYVTLHLYSTGEYVDYSTPTVKEQTGNSRKIFAAYMTQDASFVPEQFAEQGETAVRGDVNRGAAPYSVVNSSDVTTTKNKMLEMAKKEIDIFKSRQVYSGSNAAYPAYREGMFTRNTSASSNTSTSKDTFYNSSNGMLAQNMTPLNGIEALAYAYTHDFYTTNTTEKNELFDRVIKGFDFLTRAQGSNGGYFSTTSTTNPTAWIGGPDRRAASGNHLTGFGLRSVGKAFLELYENDPDKFDTYLSEMMDSDADDNNTKDQNRAIAYAAMFSAARDFLESKDGAGHAPNQDMADIIALLRFDQCLAILDEYISAHGLTTTQETTFGTYTYPYSWENQGADGAAHIQNSVDIGLGRKISAETYSYWVSPKGTILENFGAINGGYTGDYGTAAVVEMSQIVEMAAEHYYPEEKAFYQSILTTVYEAIQNYYFVENNENGVPTLYSEGIMGERNAKYPGVERYVLDPYAATSLDSDKGNVVALKIVQMFWEHGKIINDASSIYSNSGYAHFEDDALDNIRLYLSFDEIIQNVTGNSNRVLNYAFPMETDTTYAWADEMASDIVVNVKGERMYFGMNWRGWMHSQKAYVHTTDTRILPSGLTRFHRKNALYDNFGYAQNTVHGWSYSNTSGGWNYSNDYIEALFYTEYGNLTMIMNTTNCGAEYGAGDPIDYTGADIGLDITGEYTDLITGTKYVFNQEHPSSELQIPAATTIVLLDESAYEEHTVTYQSAGSVTVPVDTKTYYANNSVVVSGEVPMRSGYEFQGWLLEGTEKVYQPGDSFVMGKENAVLTAQWAKQYSLTVKESQNGTLSVSKEKPVAGDTVVVSIVPNAGYRIQAFEVNGTNVTTQLSLQDTVTYTFTMPAGDVEMLALFTKGKESIKTLYPTEDRGYRLNNKSQKGTASTVEVRNATQGTNDWNFVASLKFDLTSLLSEISASSSEVRRVTLKLTSERAIDGDVKQIHLFTNDWSESDDASNQYANKANAISEALESAMITSLVSHGKGNDRDRDPFIENAITCKKSDYKSYQTYSDDFSDWMSDAISNGQFTNDKNFSMLIADHEGSSANDWFFTKDAGSHVRTINGTQYTLEDALQVYGISAEEVYPTLVVEYGDAMGNIAQESQEALQEYYGLNYTSGDVDGNYKINTVDVLHILLYLSGKEELSATSWNAANVNGGAEVTEKDAQILLDYVSGKRASLPERSS